MSYNSVVISSGHGLYIRGASGILDEVNEARSVVDRVAWMLRSRGVEVSVFHDNVSDNQSDNLENIVSYHNSRDRQLDISVHFNAYVETTKPMGCEVLYQSQSTLAGQMSAAIADAGGFLNRGPKKRTDLYFLNNTDSPAILIETCFVDSQEDAACYWENFDAICSAIAATLKHDEGEVPWPPNVLFTATGKVSHFGGPNDMGVDYDEGLAFIHNVDDAPHLFLPYQPEGTVGLARRLNPYVAYVACRWNYDITSPNLLTSEMALIRADAGREIKAFPADWGPHPDTGRIADLSPKLMEDLGLTTDDEVEVIFPAP